MIGIFDSGLGGLSVLAAIAKALPAADMRYLADTAYVPYGNKDEAFIRARVLKIGRYLADQGCSLIVVACNTATAAAVTMLRSALPNIPVVGIEPGIKPAAHSTRSGRIAVLATESTARSMRLSSLIQRYAGNVCVDVIACPGWANRVESLQLDDPGFTKSAHHHLAQTLEAGADRIVLGCTHYTFLAPALTPLVAGRAQLVDVAEAVARQCRRLAGTAENSQGRLILQATAHPERLQAALPALGLAQLLPRLQEAAAQIDI